MARLFRYVGMDAPCVDYRADIDGLRATAVLAVLVFHFFPGVLPGGFTGVDVFFVISGFLITKILLNGRVRTDFRLLDFYGRRVRRIFPALILVIAFALLFGWFRLLHGEYRQLGKHAIAGGLFLSNFILLKESGYFDAQALLKPLQHLWSLAVEEQFYLFWPPLILFTPKNRLGTSLLLVIAGSLFVSSPGLTRNDSAAFFLPFGRFWEFGTGAGLALWLRSPRNADRTNDPMAWAGALLLVVAFTATGRREYLTLASVVGASLLIAAGPTSWINRRGLSNPALVGVGLISYPLYLWHWPLLSFAHVTRMGNVGMKMKAGLFLFSFLLAGATYLGIERPLRGWQNGRSRLFLIPGFTVLAVIVLSAAAIYSGWIQSPLQRESEAFTRYLKKNQAMDFRCFLVNETFDFFERNHCVTPKFRGGSRVLLVGDSHSARLAVGLRPYLEERKINLAQFSYAQCTPLVLTGKQERCDGISRYVTRKILELNPDVLIVSVNYILLAENPVFSGGKSYAEKLFENLKELRTAGIKQIVLIGQMPRWNADLPALVTRNFIDRHERIPLRTREGVHVGSYQWDARVREKAWRAGITYLSPKNLFCTSRGCLISVGAINGGDLVSMDQGHLSDSGARYLTDSLVGPAVVGYLARR